MRLCLLVLSMLFIHAAAFADMVEIKGEGFFNGTIESEDGDRITFKDAGGKIRTLAKKDILFMERQVEAPPARKAMQKAEQVLKKAVTEKTPAKIPSAAVKKKPASASSSGGGDATGALRAIAKAQRAMAANQAKMEKALREGDSVAEAKKDPKKGRFSSL